MIGDNIKRLRQKSKMTQKELADRLYVTSQAVSRWENGEVEPSIASITEMAKIFGVSTDTIIYEEPVEEVKEAEEVEKENYKIDETETIDLTPPPQTVVNKNDAPQKVVLAVCEDCNKPIYDAGDIVRDTYYDGSNNVKVVRCRSCEAKRLERQQENTINNARHNRRNSYIWGTLIVIGVMLLALAITCIAKQPTSVILLSTFGMALTYPLVACLFLDNNNVADIFLSVISWGCVKFPGLIITLDIDGVLWAICMKALFWILGIMISIACFILAVVIGSVVAWFVYPFALRRSILHPEDDGI